MQSGHGTVTALAFLNETDDLAAPSSSGGDPRATWGGSRTEVALTEVEVSRSDDPAGNAFGGPRR